MAGKRLHRPPKAVKASAYFAVLDIALSRGDYTAAARAQKALANLGWEIRHVGSAPIYFREGVAKS